MASFPGTFAEDVINQRARCQFESFLDEHRNKLNRFQDESCILDDYDTIASIQHAHREACESSRRATSSLGLDDKVYGYSRGPRPLHWVYLHVLRELAQHCGHADILREQILND